MRIKNSYLYWGIFLVAIGGAVLVVDRMPIDESRILDLLRLWPAVIIAIGVALVLRRTRFSVAGGMLAAALPGLVLGGMLAVGPRIAWDCAPGSDEPATYITDHGTLAGAANVAIETGCGTLSITTRTGSAWDLEAGNTRGRSPNLDSSPSSLSLRPSGGRWFGLHGRDVWRLSLPTTPIANLDLAVNAGEARIDLAGATVESLGLTTNAARSTVDLTAATAGFLHASVNAGELRLTLPADHDVSGVLTVNAGSAGLCIPDGVGVRLESSGALGATDREGLVERGGAWESPDYASAAHHADLTVSVNLGNFELDPQGGCK
jgi:hypothetical protein